MRQADKKEQRTDTDILLDIHKQILKTLQTRSVSSLIELASRIFACPVVLTDERYHRLALWPRQTIGDPVYDALVQSEVLPLEFVQSYTEAYLPGQEPRYNPFYVSQGPVGELPRIFALIHDDRQTLGHIGIILGNRSPETWHYGAATIVADAIAVILSPRISKTATDSSNLSYLLSDILDSQVSLDKRYGALQHLENHCPKPWNLLLVHSSETTDLEVLAGAVASDLSSRFPRFIVTRLKGFLILFEYQTKSSDAFQAVSRHIQTFGYKRFFLVQTENKYHYPRFMEAIYLANLTWSLPSDIKEMVQMDESTIIKVDALQSWPSLMAASAADGAKALIHPLLLQLKDTDEADESDYYNTLEAYCKHAYDRKKTSEALHIHRNTLLYRLKRIEELFQVNLENPELLLDLSISFRLAHVVK